MGGKSVVANVGGRGDTLYKTAAAVINICAQHRFVVMAGHDVIALFKQQRKRAAGIPGFYVIPAFFICAVIQGDSHFGSNTVP